MVSWDQVQTEFAGDETTNFGPRKETGTALYQVETLATISSQGQVCGAVTFLVSSALGELVCLAVDHHLHIFKHSQHEITIAFENEVEDCIWSPDGSILLVVDRSGKLFIYRADTLQSLFSYNLLPSGSKDGSASTRTFCRVMFRSNGDKCCLLLLLVSGLLLVVRDLSLAALTKGLDNLTAVIQQQLQFQTVETREVHSSQTYDAMTLLDGSLITLGSGDEELALWDWQNNAIALQDTVSEIFPNHGPGSACSSASVTSCDSSLFVVDGQGRVSIWLVPELVMLKTITLTGLDLETKICSFALLETQGSLSNSLEGLRLVVLERGLLGDAVRIVEVESGQDVYTLQLGSPTTLAKCSSTEESVYLAEATPVTGCADQVSGIRLRCLTETQPETRLQRILHKKRFDEALQFAELFQLNTEGVYRAHMTHLLDQLSPWEVVTYDDTNVAAMLEQLWTCIANIQDSQFVAETCMRAALPTFASTWKLLQLCSSKLSQSGEEAERRQMLLTKVLGLQHRLVTYRSAIGEAKYSASGWSHFQQAKLLTMVCQAMGEQQPHVAILLWRRHCEEWCDQIKLEVIQQILQCVPQKLAGSSIIGWLQEDLLPYAARTQPLALKEIVLWAVQRAVNMELAEKSGWPQNAVSFLEGITKSVEQLTEINFSTTIDTAVEAAKRAEMDAYSILEMLRSNLTTLRQLHDLMKYNLRLSLRQFQQETRETLAYCMLDQVVMVELFRPTLESYITPYIRASQLDQDHIFATYIKHLLERVGHMRSYRGQSTWEDKVLAIISFIYSPKEKCCAILNVIKHAPLPWSPEIEKLVEEGLTIQHALARELKEQKKIAWVRLVMQEYGIKSKIPNQGQAERLAHCILETGKPSSLKDALGILQGYHINSPSAISEVYFRHANILIRHDQIPDYVNLLHSLDRLPAVRLAQRVVSLAEICLEGQFHQPGVKEVMDEQKKLLTMAAVLSLQFQLTSSEDTDPVEKEELKSQLDVLSKLLALQREYGSIMSVSEYSSEVHRGVTFAIFTQQYLKEKEPFKRKGNVTALYRFAELLNLRLEEVLGELVVVEGKAENLEAVVFLCRELLQAEASSELGVILPRVVRFLLHTQASRLDDSSVAADDSPQVQELRRCLPILLQRLADKALAVCDQEHLQSCLELSKAVRLWQQVSTRCESADYSLLQLDTDEPCPVSKEPLQSYTLDAVYNDEALVMSSSVILPLSAASLTTTLALVEGDEEGDGVLVQEAVVRLQPVIAHLRENSHQQLAARFLAVAMAAIRQALVQQDMGFALQSDRKDWLDTQRSALQVSEGKISQVFQSLLSSLIVKVLSAYRVDHKMALACMLSVPRKVSVECLMKSINTCNYNFHRLEAVARVGIALGHLLREGKVISSCQELETNAIWGLRLAKLKISFKEVLQGGLHAKQTVIAALARCQQADVNMVSQFAEDFQLEAEDGMLAYLEELVRSPQGRENFQRARAAIAAIRAHNCADSLMKKLKALYKQMSPYNYEVLEFLLSEMNNMNPTPQIQKGLKLVLYLKLYTRRNPPSDFEVNSVAVSAVPDNKEEGHGGQDGGDCLPPEAASRLPFQLLLEGEPFKIFTAELDAETVPMWIQIALLLELSTDEVYLMAVQNVVRRYVSQTLGAAATTSLSAGSSAKQRVRTKPTSARSWCVNEGSLQMLEEVHGLLSSVQNCEMALACANWVVRELPMGADKVLGLKGCVAFAQRWYQACDDSKKEKALAASRKFQKVLNRVLTEQVLYTHHLAQPPLLQLVPEPPQLITALMEHPAVLGQDTAADHAPDIYSAVEKVCDVNELDLSVAVTTEISKWLLSTESSNDADTTMNLSYSDLKLMADNSESSRSENIKRVLYFLHRGPKHQMLRFLVDTVEKGEAESTSHLGRMHCLYCLLQIASNADLQPLGQSKQSIREMLHLCHYLTRLEELHIQHSASTLASCSKPGLVKAIWRNHRHQKLAVKLVADLSLDYRMYDSQQWAQILQQMITLNMLTELEHVVERLCCAPSLWSLPVFAAAWQAVLLAPLDKASLPLTDEQTRTCLHSFNLLHSCPVLAQLKLPVLREQFERLGLAVCTVACLLLDPRDSQAELAEHLGRDLTGLIQSTYSLTGHGLSLPAAAQVRDAAFGLILRQGDYRLVPPQAMQDFIHYIISHNDIDGCLLFAVSNDLVPQAETLVELYFQRYPQQEESLIDWCQKQRCDTDSTLQAYLRMKKLL